METIEKQVHQWSCPFCQTDVSKETEMIVDAQQMPEAREAILSGEYFRWACPNCGKRVRISREILYCDRKNHFVVLLLPGRSPESIEQEDWSVKNYMELSGFTKRIVSDINFLKEKILILESGLNDAAIELSKLVLAHLVRKKYNRPIRAAYFARYDEEKQMMGISFQFVGEGRTVLYQTKLEMYEVAAELCKMYFASVGSLDRFYFIGSDWAKRVIEWDQKEEEEH